MEQLNYYRMKAGEYLNSDISELPQARLMNISAEETGRTYPVRNFKIVRVTSPSGEASFVYCPTPRYRVVQHSEAFRPTIEGMTLAGVDDFRYILTATDRKANLQIYVGDPINVNGNDQVYLGFSITNSYDGSSAIRFGYRLLQTNSYIEIIGYRQICSNGMKIRVPLNEAEIIRPEIVTRIKELLASTKRFLHTPSAEANLREVQYITEAISLLRSPIEALIRKAKRISLTDTTRVKALIEYHVGKRMAKHVLKEYENEPQDLWGLYNAITYIASHKPELKDITRERLLDNASELLLVEAR